MNLHNDLWNLISQSDHEYVDLENVIMTFRLLMDPV